MWHIYKKYVKSEYLALHIQSFRHIIRKIGQKDNKTLDLQRYVIE